MRSGIPPLDQRPEADAAGDDENQRTVAEILQHAAKPAQELVDSQGVAVFFEHPVEKDRKLVNHEEYGLFVMSAFVEQVLPVATPVLRHPILNGSEHENRRR